MNRKLVYKVDRPIYSFEELKKDYPEENVPFNVINSLKSRFQCKKPSVTSIFSLILPLPFILSTFYTLKFFILDVVSGFTMVIFHIPQGLAYGLLSGLQPVNGLYASFFPPLIYAFFGTSRQLSIGTFSIMSLLSSVPVLREAKIPLDIIINNTTNTSSTLLLDDAYELAKLKVSISTTLLAGILQVALGILQFGCLVSYMSDALIDGFTSAAAVHVVMSQLSNMLGVSIKPFSGIGELPYKTYLYCQRLKEVHIPTVIVTSICVIILMVFSDFINPIFKKKFRFPFPIQFVIVVLATIISYFSNLNERFNVKIVGPIPKGLPMAMVPDIIYWQSVLTDAILLAVIGFVMNSSLAKVYSLKFAYDVNYNQEATAYGMSNIFGSFFQCTMSAAALARTSVVVDVGMKSQIGSLVSCLLMFLIILFIGPLFVTVPKAVLSAIIVVSLKGMLTNIQNLPRLWFLSKFDFAVWVVTYLSTLLLNVPFGMVFGFIFSLLTILVRLQNPKSQVLGQIPGTDIYKNIKIFKDAKQIPGIKIFRYDAPLYFANSEHFQEKVFKKTSFNPNTVISIKKKTNDDSKENHSLTNDTEVGIKYSNHTDALELRYLIIDLSSVNYIDNVGIRILDDMYKSYYKKDIKVYLACPNKNCRDMLERADFAQENRNRICFVSVHDAVLSTDVYHDI